MTNLPARASVDQKVAPLHKFAPIDIAAEIRLAMPLIKSCATPYVRSGILEREDAVQTAIAGFIKGANHYDPGKGAGLRTYATYWIKAELQIEANKQLYLNVPLGLSKEVIAMRKRGDIPKTGKRAHAEDTLKSARDAMSMAFRRVAPDGYGAPGKTRNNGLPAASLSAASLTETNPQFGVELSDVDAGRLCDYRKMRRLVDRIPSKVQKHCIYHRFYLDQTLEEIGAELGISREGVRQNIERGLQAMRAMLDMPANDPKAARGKRHAGRKPASRKPAGRRAAASLENIMSPLKEDF